MAAVKKVDKVRGLLEPIAEELGLYVYDLELTHGRRPQLRISAERKKKSEGAGVTVSELTRLSRTLDRALEVELILGADYALEVGSPGLERALKNRAHFEGAIGEFVQVTTTTPIGGDNQFEGGLSAVEGEALVLDAAEKKRTIELELVRRARTIFK